MSETLRKIKTVKESDGKRTLIVCLKTRAWNIIFIGKHKTDV